MRAPAGPVSELMSRPVSIAFVDKSIGKKPELSYLTTASLERRMKVKLTLLSVFLLSVPFSRAGNQLRIPQLNATAGSRLVVPILATLEQNVAGLQFVVEYDPQVLTYEERSAFGGSLLTDHQVAAAGSGAQVRVLVFSSALAPLSLGEGSVAQLQFSLSGAAPGDSTPLRLMGVRATDPAGNPVDFSFESESIRFNEQENVPAADENLLVFPHLANGAFDGGNFFVTLVLLNRTDAVVDGEIEILQADGTPFFLTLVDGRSGSAFSFSMRPRGSVFLQTDGLGALSAGYARAVASGPMGGVLIFTAVSDEGRLLAEAGVGASPAGLQFTVPVLYSRGEADTGIGLANLTDESVIVALRLKDSNGTDVAQTQFSLPASQQVARFSVQFFGLLADRADFRGSLEVIASGLISAVALEQKGLALTTFPVVKRN